MKNSSRLTERKSYVTGATRGKDADETRYDLICPAAILEVARIYAEGASTHGPNNYCLGMPIGEVINHAKRHITIAERGGDAEGDSTVHFAKAIWNLLTTIHFMKKCNHHKISAEWEKKFGLQQGAQSGAKR